MKSTLLGTRCGMSLRTDEGRLRVCEVQRSVGGRDGTGMNRREWSEFGWVCTGKTQYEG